MTAETFSALLAPNLASVRTLVRSRVRSDHADDIVQQALLRAFVFRGQLRSESKFKSWLWQIAINEVRAFLRGSRPSASLDEVPLSEFADGTPSPLARFEQRERQLRLRAGMAKLKERDSITIRLVDFDGLSRPDAAREMGVSLAAFKSIHFRARLRLIHAMREAA